MAFLTDDVKDHIACVLAYRWARDTLGDWLAGRERSYAVRAVLRELQALPGFDAWEPAALIETALTLEPDAEDERFRLVRKALGQLGQQLRAGQALTHVPYRD